MCKRRAEAADSQRGGGGKHDWVAVSGAEWVQHGVKKNSSGAEGWDKTSPRRKNLLKLRVRRHLKK